MVREWRWFDSDVLGVRVCVEDVFPDVLCLILGNKTWILVTYGVDRIFVLLLFVVHLRKI